MSRRIPSFVALAGLALAAAACASSPEPVASDPPAPSAEAAAEATVAPTVTPSTGPDEAEGAETGGDRTEELARLLPDASRWVVVQDWSERSPEPRRGEPRLQLDVAPIDGSGVPDLGRRISLVYRLGAAEDFEDRWGDAASLGESVDFAVEGGRGRVVRNANLSMSLAQVWSEGTFITIQAMMDPDADVEELARSVTTVEPAAWTAARQGAADQRLLAVEAAMADIEPVAPIDEPLPHWVLPEPWEPEWVTDMTIWTAEEHAQSAALGEASQPNGLPEPPTGTTTAYLGFGENADDAARQFIPEVSMNISVLSDVTDPMHPGNYESISALGLDGVISPSHGGAVVELGTDTIRVFITTRTQGVDLTREFLENAAFATNDPLDGIVIDDERFQELVLPDAEQRWPAWHASWTRPEGGRATTSVWRLSPPELQLWLSVRGRGIDVPDDVWEQIAADQPIDFGSGLTYDPGTGILMSLVGVDLDDLVPIELGEWIELVAPVNADPLNPR